MLGGGKRLEKGRPPKRLQDQLQMAWEGVQLLHTLAALSIELPDIEPERWLVHHKQTPSLSLVDFSDARRSEPSAASIGHSEAAHKWTQWVFQEKNELSAQFRQKIARKTPLPVLASALLQERMR
jgi:hypothetical protein